MSLIPVEVYFDTDSGRLVFRTPADEGLGDVVVHTVTASASAADKGRLPDPEDRA